MDPRMRRRIGWATLAVVVLGGFGLLAVAVHQNRDRAEGWRQRAIGAEEIVEGQRVVIAQRSRELNRRTTQVNALTEKVRATRTALRRSEGDVSELARRQRALANEKARVEDERRQLEAQQAALTGVASDFLACNNGLVDVLGAVLDEDWSWVSIYGRSRLSSCTEASASLDSYRQRFE
jgi:septal ring factor EnvC (AmiA/AmiB activator)